MTLPFRAPEAAQKPVIGAFVRVAGRRAHVLRSGRGPRVLLLHGNGSLAQEILSVFRPLQGIGWIAPDRPGFGLSSPLPTGAESPPEQAAWVIGLLDALGIERIHLVAHSLAAGTALCLASRHPRRIHSVTLVNPFCRPTPHRWMPGLRLAVAPGLGRVIRAVLPAILASVRGRVLRGLTTPNAVPKTLRSLPISHAARPRAVLTLAAELRSFNDGMLKADPRVGAEVPVIALLGACDKTAEPDWHLPWLRRRVVRLDARVLPGLGHMLHHVRPQLARSAVVTQLARATEKAPVAGTDGRAPG